MMHWLALYSIALLKFMAVADHDVSLKQYSPNGGIIQLNYAAKAVQKSSPIIAWRNRNYAVMLSFSKPNSRLLKSLHQTMRIVDDSILTAVTGYLPDALQIFKKCNIVAQQHRLRFDEQPSLENICKTLGRYLTKGMFTLFGDDDEDDHISRPFAVSTVLATFDDSIDSMKLTRLENSGVYIECPFVILGSLTKTLVETIEMEILSKNGENLRHKCSIILSVGAILNHIEEEVRSKTNGDDDCELIFECGIVSKDGSFIARSPMSRLELLEEIKIWETKMNQRQNVPVHKDG